MSETTTGPAPPRPDDSSRDVIATVPLPPVRRLDGTVRETWSVTVDGAAVGFVQRDAGGDWHWRLLGMVDAVPARFGLRLEAIGELVAAGRLPTGWARRNVPAELKIVRVAEGTDGE